MSEVVVNVEDLIGPLRPTGTSADDDMLVVFSPDDGPAELAAAFRKLWGMVLLMSVRDRATSVHYHPWRGEGALFYVVDNTRYEMVPPPAEYAGACADTARTSFITPAGFFARLFGRERAACGTLTLTVGGNLIVWDVVCWSSGARRGVDLFRVTPLEPREERTNPGSC